MNLDNLRIEIKRATQDGIKKTIGRYFECGKVDYCFIKDTKDGCFYIIHLDTGCSICKLAINGTNENKAFELLKQKVSEFDKTKLTKAVEKKREEMKSMGFAYPLN